MGAQQSSASAGGGGAHDLGIVTVSEGRRAAGTGAGRGGGPLPATKDLPMISDPQAVATLEALADLRQLVPVAEGKGEQDLASAVNSVSAAEQLGGQLGEMVGARRAWAADQVAGVIQAQQGIHRKIDSAEGLANQLMLHNGRAAADMQALDRQLLQLSQLASDMEAVVVGVQAVSARLASVRAMVQNEGVKNGRGAH